MNMQEYDARCREAVDQYEALAPFLPFASPAGVAFTRGWLEAGCRALREQSFTVAACGQIKAGKSTLLNALFFEEDLIPEADTPLTAAITLIRHTDGEPYFEVDWYSREEWAENERALREKEREAEAALAGGDEAARKDARAAQKALKDRAGELAAMREKGVTPDALPGRAPERVTPLCRDGLEKYVSPVRQGAGVFTPLVRHVTIHANNPLLERLIVVDTPGTNDTNVARSNLTLSWIARADAVIFLTYAGRAFDQKDWSFINEFLIGIRPECLFLVINKADTLRTVTTLREQEAFVRQEILENPEVRRREGFINGETPYAFVSALAERLLQKERRGESFSEEEAYYARKIEERGGEARALLHENFAKFRAALVEKLVKNSGALLLEAQARKLESAWEAAREAAEEERAGLCRMLDDLGDSQQGLDAKRAALAEALRDLDTRGRETVRAVEAATAASLGRLEGIVRRTRERLARTLADEITACADREAFRQSLPWQLKAHLARSQRRALIGIEEELADLQNAYRVQVQTLEEHLARQGVRGLGRVKASCEANVGALFTGFLRAAAESFSKRAFQEFYERHRTTFLGIFEIRKWRTLEEAKREAGGLAASLGELLREPQAELAQRVRAQGSEVARSIANAFRRVIQKQTDDVEEARREMDRGHAGLEARRARIGARLAGVGERLERIRDGATAFAAWKERLEAACSGK